MNLLKRLNSNGFYISSSNPTNSMSPLRLPKMSDFNRIRHSDEETASSLPHTKDTENVSNAITQDAVFGEITEDGPNYRSVCIRKYMEHMK